MKRIKLISYLVGFAACINTFAAEAVPLGGYEFEGNGRNRVSRKGPAIDVKGNNFFRQLTSSKVHVNKEQYEVSFDITVTSGNVGVGILKSKKKGTWLNSPKGHVYSTGQHKGKVTITKSPKSHVRLAFSNVNKAENVNFVVNSVKFTHKGGTMFPVPAQPKGGCNHTCDHTTNDYGRSDSKGYGANGNGM